MLKIQVPRQSKPDYRGALEAGEQGQGFVKFFPSIWNMGTANLRELFLIKG